MRHIRRIALYLSFQMNSQEFKVWSTVTAGLSLGVLIIASSIASTNNSVSQLGSLVLITVCIAFVAVAVLVIERIGNTMLMIEADKRNRPDVWKLGTLPPNFMEDLAADFREKEEKRLKEQKEMEE